MLPIGRPPQPAQPSQSEYLRILPRYPGLAAVEHASVQLQPQVGHGVMGVAGVVGVYGRGAQVQEAQTAQVTGQKRELAQLTAEEKKQRRLKKNRESARECRRRKKEQVQSLQAQITHLEAENLQLRLQLKVGPEAMKREYEDSLQITAKLDEMIQNGASEMELNKMIDSFKEKYSDYGRDRRSAIDFHMAQLQQLVRPTRTTQSAVWLMNTVLDYHNPDGTPIAELFDPTHKWEGTEKIKAELWRDLLTELQLTTEQQLAFIAKEPEIRPLQEELQATLDMLERLDTLASSKNENLDNEMSEIQSILNPRQIVKFILWITNNPACMHMLNQLWNALYPQTKIPQASSPPANSEGADSHENDTSSLSSST